MKAVSVSYIDAHNVWYLKYNFCLFINVNAAQNSYKKCKKYMNSLLPNQTKPAQTSDYKSNNLQYNMLGYWVNGRIISSTKCLMFQLLFFS